MKIAINGKIFLPETTTWIQEVFNELHQYNSEILISEKYLQILRDTSVVKGDFNIYTCPDDLHQTDVVISLGGDGTLLETVTHVGSLQIPILGINTGRLGFLATTPKDNIKEALAHLYNRRFSIEERTLIHLDSDKDIFEGLNFGLNEFTIIKRDTSQMIVVHTYIDGEYLNSYWADGLIVATPTGSTGYSLSCGGPLVLPRSNNFIITPVSPHNLNVRPMVVSDHSTISFEIEGRSDNFLVSLDSRSYVIDSSVKLAVRKEEFKVKLVKLEGYQYLDMLRHKLKWGWDFRN